MRKYFKKAPSKKEAERQKEIERFQDFLEGNACDYFEKEDDEYYGVFKMPEKHDTRAAVKLEINGTVTFGCIDEDCDNFRDTDSGYFPKEIVWLQDTLGVCFYWNPDRPAKAKKITK